MKQSENINELAAALCKAQEVMPKAKMSGRNLRFENKAAGITGAFANLDDVLDAVKGSLSKHGIALTQHAYSHRGEVGVETMLLHSSGQWMRSRFGVPAGKHDAQAYGSIVSYCRRYALSSICGISADEDQDGEDIKEVTEYITGAQVTTIKKALRSAGIEEARLLKYKGIDNLAQLEAGDYQAALTMIKAQKK